MCGPKGRGSLDVLARNRGRILGGGPHTPTQSFWEYPLREKLLSTIYENVSANLRTASEQLIKL